MYMKIILYLYLVYVTIICVSSERSNAILSKKTRLDVYLKSQLLVTGLGLGGDTVITGRLPGSKWVQCDHFNP